MLVVGAILKYINKNNKKTLKLNPREEAILDAALLYES